MSWASSEWKDGLSHQALKKVEELEKQRDRMTKEMKQHRLQIDSIEQIMSKQKEKQEMERITHSSLVSDNAALVSSCDKLEVARHRLQHELGIKNNRLETMEVTGEQTRRLLDEESSRATGLETKVNHLEHLVLELEEKEQRSSTHMKGMRNTLQDQHWTDIARLADEKQSSGALKVELLRSRAMNLYNDTTGATATVAGSESALETQIHELKEKLKQTLSDKEKSDVELERFLKMTSNDDDLREENLLDLNVSDDNRADVILLHRHNGA